VDPSVSRRGTCDRGIWTKPLAFAADAEGYINIMVWGFNGRFAISSPSGHANWQFCWNVSSCTDAYYHLQSSSCIIPHKLPPRTRDSVRRASGFVQIAISLIEGFEV